MKYTISFPLFILGILLAGCGGSSTTTSPQLGEGNPDSGNGGQQTRQIGSDRRLAVRNECWYALDDGWLNNSNPNASDQAGPMPGSVVGNNNSYMSKPNWAYLSSGGGYEALQYIVRDLYRGYCSNLIPSTDGSLSGYSADYWISRFQNTNYSLNFNGNGGRGHGLQCPSFASLIIFRATGYRTGNLNAKRITSDGPASSALPGDVVFNTTIGGGWGHTAICVRNYNGVVTVVDSNYVGGDGKEVIGRHDIAANDLVNWKRYKGQGRWY